MRSLCSGVAFAVAAAVSLLAAFEASAQPLKVAGTGGAMGMVERVATEFATATGTQIEIIAGLGSSGAIAATADGAVDLAVSARDLKPEETARGVTAVLFARTPLVFVTSHREPGSVKSADVAGIFSAANPQWPDGSPIRVILRTKSDTDSAIIAQLFPGMAEAIEAARQRPDVPVAPTDQDNATLAETLQGSFVQAGLSQILTEKRNLRLVRIDGVEATLENLENGTYPYEKPFYLVYSATTGAAAESLLGFLRSEKGRNLLRDAGMLPVEG